MEQPAIPGVPVDENLQRGLQILGKIGPLLNIEEHLGLDLDQPAERPRGTRIELENLPGYRFQVIFPASGISFGNVFLIVFTLFWCGFMVVWNGIAISQGRWEMLAFGLMHDAVAVFLTGLVIWMLFGVETITIEQGQLRIFRKALFLRFRNEFPVSEIDDVEFRRSRQNNSTKYRLNLIISGRAKKIGGSATLNELRWVRTQMLDFLKPFWK